MKVRLLGLVAALSFSLFLPPTSRADQINGVAFFGTPANPTVVIYGSGFGTEPAPTTLGYPGFTGYDYGLDFYFEDLSTSHGFSAGRGLADTNLRDYVGLVVLYYSDSLIIYQFGSDYSEFYYPQGYFGLEPGDAFFVSTDATYTGTVAYTAGPVPFPTPEPATVFTLLIGLLGAVGVKGRRRSTT